MELVSLSRYKNSCVYAAKLLEEAPACFLSLSTSILPNYYQNGPGVTVCKQPFIIGNLNGIFFFERLRDVFNSMDVGHFILADFTARNGSLKCYIY